MDIENFKISVIPLRQKLQNLARSILNSETDAEDAVQETLIRMWNVRDQLTNHPNVDAFAMQTIKNICIDRLRSRRTTNSLDNVQVQSESKSPYAYTEENDKIAIVRKIMEALPELQQKILQMRDVDGYEFSEIADITGVSEETIRVTLSRARKKVRDLFMNIENKNAN